MCQLAAYVGDRPIAPLLLESLKLQEGYFGGQATGLATIQNDNLNWVKSPGPVDYFVSNNNILELNGKVGIAHSRLSETSVTDERFNRAKNAHPFTNAQNSIALMHNGIITNYKKIWSDLSKTYEFKSYNEDINYITDSEVAVHLIDSKLSKGKTLKTAIQETANQLEGMVLLLIISKDEPETIYVTNWIQACILGIGDNENIFSSSPLGIKNIENEFDIFMAPRNSLIKMTRDGFKITRLDKTRDAPKSQIDGLGFRDAIIQILAKKNKQTCLEILLDLNKSGGEKLFGITLGEWKDWQRVGWGDQNQIVNNLNLMVEEGLINYNVEQRLEGGVVIPRVVWSLRE